ncbi:MAG TPA: hypothetical protein VGM75_06650 [Pseudonocardiaceae bacterium]|jgi:hypothetical protein
MWTIRGSSSSRLNHPQVGEIELQSNKFTVNGCHGLMLVVFHAPPGSRSAELLGILGSLAASPKQASAQTPDSTKNQS